MDSLDVVIHLLIAFDIGYEIDLDAAGRVLPGETGTLPRRRRTPESIRYRPAPLRISVDPAGVSLPGEGVAATASRAQLSLFDFGALSLALAFPVRLTREELLRTAAALAEPGPLTAAARRLIEPWIERLRPAVSGFEISELSEEYVVFQLGEVDAAWLSTNADWVAALVRLEPGPFSAEEVREATRLHLAYAPTDLVVVDWAAGVVADTDCADTLQVIEFANVQLLEFRHIDDRLDDRLEAAYRQIRPEPRRGLPLSLRHGHASAVRNIRELEIEATSLFERADNALKLVGDQYLSRVYGLVSARFHLGGWQQSIRRKLETVGDVYDLLVQQTGGARMELLEIVVVVLIAVEIALALIRRH